MRRPGSDDPHRHERKLSLLVFFQRLRLSGVASVFVADLSVFLIFYLMSVQGKLGFQVSWYGGGDRK